MAIKELIGLKKHLFLCNGGTCKLNGAEEATALIRRVIYDAGLTDEIHTTKTLCNGRCKDGPVVIGVPEGIWFKQISPENAVRLAEEYLVAGQIPPDLILYRYGDNAINPVEPAPTAEEKIS